MILFTEAKPPELSPLISIVIQQEVVEPPPIEKIYTIEEKISININNCNEETQYIRADNAECLDKPVYVPPKAQSPARGAVNQSKSYASNGWYSPSQCTGYVASRRPVGQWGNAITWPSYARAEGWTVSSVPVTGAIGQRGNHVVYIEQVRGDQVYISERNWDYNGSYREMWRPISYYTYIY